MDLLKAYSYFILMKVFFKSLFCCYFCIETVSHEYKLPCNKYLKLSVGYTVEWEGKLEKASPRRPEIFSIITVKHLLDQS